MTNNVEDTYIECPYYKYESSAAIHCEGVEDGTKLHLGFSSRYRLHSYKQRLCRGDWKKCLIAKMLNGKYDYQP